MRCGVNSLRAQPVARHGRKRMWAVEIEKRMGLAGKFGIESVRRRENKNTAQLKGEC
jgi:hypothetical protein